MIGTCIETPNRENNKDHAVSDNNRKRTEKEE